MLRHSMFPRNEPARPFNPDGFATVLDVHDYLKTEYLSKLQAGEPFLLVTRFIKHVQTSCSIDHGTYANVLVTKCYIGTSRLGQPLYEFDGEDIVINAHDYVTVDFERMNFHRSETGVPGSRKLSIRYSDFDTTPLKKEFRPPHSFSPEEVRAFELAVGIEAMESVCALMHDRFDRHTEEFSKAYVYAVRVLGLEIKSWQIQAILRSLQSTMLENLLKNRMSISPLILEQSRMLGLDKERDKIKIDGIRYCPAEVFEDVLDLLPKEKKQ